MKLMEELFQVEYVKPEFKPLVNNLGLKGHNFGTDYIFFQ